MKKTALRKVVIGLCGAAVLLFLIALGYYHFHVIGGKIIEIKANPQKGFNFNYYLYLPYDMEEGKAEYLLVEPNNAGHTSDDHEVHEKDSLHLIKHGLGHEFSSELKTPLLVPVFDRPSTDWKMYTHALDRDTLNNAEGDLARIDLQLINMIKDAKEQLSNKRIQIADKVFMTGFSASGSFVNRFTALHPELVKAVAAGGLNCMPILPAEEWDGEKLIYPIGVYDINEIAEIPFDMEEYKKVPQYIYMGSLDDNDTLPCDDAFDDEERELIKRFLGEAMHDRWEKSKRIYQEMEVPATMIMYEGIGHGTDDKIRQDVLDFFKAQYDNEKAS